MNFHAGINIKPFIKKAGYTVIPNRVKRGGWLWGVWWKRKNRYFEFPDHAGIEKTEAGATSQAEARLGDLQAFAIRQRVDGPLFRAIAYGRAAGISDIEATAKLAAHRKKSGRGDSFYMAFHQGWFKEHHAKIPELIRLARVDPDEYWRRVRKRYTEEVELWKAWNATEGAKQRAWDAMFNAAKYAWINATDEWRTNHREEYEEKWGCFLSLWNFEIDCKQKDSQKDANDWEDFFHFRFNLSSGPSLKKALQRLGVDHPDEIAVKQAYRRQAKQCHPDTGGSHEAFLQLREDFELALAHCTEKATYT